MLLYVVLALVLGAERRPCVEGKKRGAVQVAVLRVQRHPDLDPLRLGDVRVEGGERLLDQGGDLVPLLGAGEGGRSALPLRVLDLDRENAPNLLQSSA